MIISVKPETAISKKSLVLEEPICAVIIELNTISRRSNGTRYLDSAFAERQANRGFLI